MPAADFQGAVEMCNNNGACRKIEGGVMCPSYRVTRDERDVTRGRANSLRLAITGQLGPDALTSDEMAETMKLCVSCKACRRECPTGVDMARMKIEVMAARAARFGFSLRDRMIGWLPRYAPYAVAFPWLLNARNVVPGAAWLWLPAWSRRAATCASSARRARRRRRKLAAQRERERATRRALVRARQIAVGCAVLAVLAVASAIYGYFATERAKDAEAKSEETRLMAEQARGEAEKLVVFLLDDFHLELAPVGRLDIVASLAKRAIDYYDGLPPPLRTPQTERNRSLALVRYGTVLRTQSRLDEGRKAIDEAVATLTRLREQGDRSELTAIGLALGSSTKARIASSLDQDSAGLADSAKAVATLRPLAETPDSSPAVRRAYGEVLNMHGFLQLRSGDEASLPTFERARAAFRSIADLAMTDASAAASYAEATAWMVEGYLRQERIDDAIRAADEVLAVTGKVLNERPGHMQAVARAGARDVAAVPRTAHAGPDGGGARDERSHAHGMEGVRAARPGQHDLVEQPGGRLLHPRRHPAGHGADRGRGGELPGGGGARARDQAEHHALERARQPRRPAGAGGGDAGPRGPGRRSAGHRPAAARLVDHAAPGRHVRAQPAAAHRPVLAVRDGRRAWSPTSARCRPARRLSAKVEPLEPSAGSSERADWVVWLGFAYANLAVSAHALGDLALAERAIERGQALRRSLTGMQLDWESRQYLMQGEAIRTMVLARGGKLAEAQAVVAPALEYQRAVAARPSVSAAQEYDHAVALYAAALAGVGNRAALLSEAASRMDRLPAELRAARSTVAWRSRIAEEMGGGAALTAGTP